ncbi:MAG: ammonium transporter [Kineosporiaceae bacterium]|nr:ammonium transporter [Kineosporiaceae bacterium]MBK7625374.1 ammonium transporter [Kineosporiaceae bacterium]MBK8076263.1 ammonium transporter [Kineosporiaceae bacterium]
MDSGDTAWVLASAALVLLMTPGLALFYGGMVRAKSVLNMMMMSFVTIGIVSVLWVLFGYSIAFGGGTSSLFGDLSMVGLGEALNDATTFNGAEYKIPTLVFAMFQLMFAVITPALISGAIADRAKFLGWSVFVTIWVSLVYFPVAHWVFDFGDADGNGKGLLAGWGVLDFAGGTAVHINAGAAGLALAIVLGKRNGWPKAQFKPHNLPLVLTGAGLLWFGWFGFNAGSALSAGTLAGLAFTNTQVATAAAVIGWLAVEKLRDGHATSLGAASGAVAGLVAITPACAFIVPWSAALLGVIAGALCALAVGLKYRFGFDDSLDVVGVHLVGGLVGCLYLGFMATERANGAGSASANGLFYGGGAGLLWIQTKGALLVLVYSFVMAAIIGLAIDKTIGFRLNADDQEAGADLVEHAETGYELGATTAGGYRSGSVLSGATKVTAPSATSEVPA